jgi:tRNA threonylcarbamoyl adenosine modification protein YeaZ
MTYKTLVLAVETSSRIGSVAIALGEKILAETTFSAPIRHSAEIFPAISDILNRFSKKPQNIEQIYISSGPGSFTGLRIAVTLAKSMHLASAAKIIALDTLDVIAANANDYIEDTSGRKPPERIATVLDAKRGQFFIAVYERLHENTVPFLRNLSSTPIGEQESTSHSPLSALRYPLIKVFPDSIMTAPQFLDRLTHDERPIWLLGDGLLYHKDKFKADSVRFFDEKYWSPRASKVLALGFKKALTEKFEDPLTLTPNYLLRPDIKIKAR